MLVREGLVTVEVDGVFYNPRMKFCRDLDVVLFRAMPGRSYLDALSASGIRGIRAKLEAGKEPTFNDISPEAVRVIRENLKRNGITAEVWREDANVVMRKKHFDHVDIDPFGSPAAFIDSMCFSAKKSISVTATDTAALCGSAVNSCLRKYSCFVEKVEFYNEVGLRVLAGKIACEATKYDKAPVFVASWAKEHYYRVHAVVRRSPRLAAKVYENVGYLVYCRNCLWRKPVSIRESLPSVCERCSGKLSVYGPLWTGKLKDDEVLERACRKCEDERALQYLSKLLEEEDCPFYYELHEVCRRLETSPPGVNEVVERLREMGYRASRTVLSGTGVRCNADIGVIESVLKDLNERFE